MSPLLLALSLLLAQDAAQDAAGHAADPAPAVAQDEAEEDDEFDFIRQGEEAEKAREAERNRDNSFDEEDDDEYADFAFDPAPAPRSSAPPPTAPGVLPDIIGMDKLQDNYTPRVSSPAAKVVVVELPVLVAHSSKDYDGRAFWVVTQVFADGMPVGSTRNEVRRETLATSGPTFVFVKLQVPVPDQTGELEIRVGVATASGGQPKPLFSRKVSYQTK